VPARVRLVIVGAVVCATAAAFAVVLLGGGGEQPVPGVGPSGFAGSVRPPGAPAPPFTGLRDERGREAGALGEGPAVVTFLYATCDDTCPLQVQQIRAALDDLGRDVPVYGVSVDPANDTRDAARRFLTEQSMTGRMRFLLGDERALSRVWKAYGIAPQTQGRDHSAYVVVVDDGLQRVGFPASALTPEGLEHDLRKLGA
jgi:protein SCO1/2